MASIELSVTELQPEFPVEDLTEKNARMLEVMLANRSELSAMHTAAGLGVPIFRRLHMPLVESTRVSYEGAQTSALSHGMTVFEAMNAAVGGAQLSAVDPRLGGFVRVMSCVGGFLEDREL